MATLVLGAIGTLVGGPIGGAIGALAGRQIDSQIMGRGGSEGPRLKDLALTTSSYGNAIPRHFGRMRTAGAIIWSTDLVENRESSGGGKGKPKTTTFSYTTSFAVALSSRPILDIGKIWADGNLLRGAAGDLKTGGTFRLHRGHGGQPVDPLIAAAEGARCPAFRNCAYVVFEDLDLSDFGNRIPALTFEVIADDGQISVAHLMPPESNNFQCDIALPVLQGLSYEGGSLANTLAIIDTLFPISSDAGGSVLTLSDASIPAAVPVPLPEATGSWNDDDFGSQSGASRSRRSSSEDTPDALRYYDVARDYQPGIQRADGRARAGQSRTLEFPGAMDATGARSLANRAALRTSWLRETMSWRIAELDPEMAPGKTVKAPDIPGLWTIANWEWRETGIELQLTRLPPFTASTPAGDHGQPWSPPDQSARETWLRAFELPWDGRGSAESPSIFAAATSSGSNWGGAALFYDNQGSLTPADSTGSLRSISGTLAVYLKPSESVLFERDAYLDVELAAPDLQFRTVSMAELAMGANRLLVGEEVLQFASAQPLDERLWRLTGLLRGRGGTELAAQNGHLAGARATLIDESLVPLDLADIPPIDSIRIAAIGRGDEEPVVAVVENPGVSLRPLSPVHARTKVSTDGTLILSWTRRARGSWQWRDEVGVPLVEQSEVYRVGIGPVASPRAIWETTLPELTLTVDDLASAGAVFGGAVFWVRQVGTYAQSDPLFLTSLN